MSKETTNSIITDIKILVIISIFFIFSSALLIVVKLDEAAEYDRKLMDKLEKIDSIITHNEKN